VNVYISDGELAVMLPPAMVGLKSMPRVGSTPGSTGQTSTARQRNSSLLQTRAGGRIAGRLEWTARPAGTPLTDAVDGIRRTDSYGATGCGIGELRAGLGQGAGTAEDLTHETARRP
jgi:hypothetical protein